MPPKGQYFRANAGIVLLNSVGKLLMLERADVPGAWQFCQGGIDVGEDPEDSALRELGEETGIQADSVRLLAVYPEWLTYELPPEARSEKTGRGQTQRWFFFEFYGSDEDIDLYSGEHEFSSFQWVDAEDVIVRAVEFRKPTYGKLVDFLRHRVER